MQLHQAMIMRFKGGTDHGIQSHQYAKNAIGYVEFGTKNIYNGDNYFRVNAGELYFLPSGIHYTEELSDHGEFCETVFCFDNDILSRAINSLAVSEGADLSMFDDHRCSACSGPDLTTFPAWQVLRRFYDITHNYMTDNLLVDNEMAERLKFTELIYLLISHPECCLKSRIFECYNSYKEDMEHIVRNNIFNDMSVTDLARNCNRSLTSFKNEFKDTFKTTPHKWIVRQRLIHARMQLMSTNKSISEIGIEAQFHNTSHFIKLFKKEFGVTPASYRQLHTRGKVSIGQLLNVGT